MMKFIARYGDLFSCDWPPPTAPAGPPTESVCMTSVGGTSEAGGIGDALYRLPDDGGIARLLPAGLVVSAAPAEAFSWPPACECVGSWF